jgi:UDP-N-acetylglucosamine--N-acetylmuramyl-(pentapeptide) pyrophosphoryl-undecaprenol N-acetylglucosamine transferase
MVAGEPRGNGIDGAVQLQRQLLLSELVHQLGLALDQDQFANAGVLAAAGGALRLPQDEFTPARLAGEITRLASAPEKLVAMAQAARSQGVLDAAERLADLVQQTMRKPA